MAKVIIDLKKEDLISTMQSSDGQKVLAWVLAKTGLMASDGGGSTENVHRQQGKRKLGDELLSEMLKADDTLTQNIVNNILLNKAERLVGKKGEEDDNGRN